MRKILFSNISSKIRADELIKEARKATRSQLRLAIQQSNYQLGNLLFDIRYSISTHSKPLL
ncbi:MAG: hypothetical protein ACRCZ2_05235 [Fusobacteriaceae bacterium]